MANRYQAALGIVALSLAAASFQAPEAEASCSSNSWNANEMCADGSFHDICRPNAPQVEYCCDSNC
jgi:hypothetical protein